MLTMRSTSSRTPARAPRALRALRALGAILGAGLIAAALLAGCDAARGAAGSAAASYTITYPGDDGADVVVAVEIADLDCWEAGEMRYYGDASAPDGAVGDGTFGLSASREPVGDRQVVVVYLPFGDGLVFQSNDVVEADAEGFRFADLEGFVRDVDAPLGEVVAAVATADGSGTC